MELVTGKGSTLNPNAPLFIPAAFRQVEDFSPEWWNLMKSSTWYGDYWLSQNSDGFNNNADEELERNDVLGLLPDSIDFSADDDFSSMEAQFEEFIQFTEAEAMKGDTNAKSITKSQEVNGVRAKPNPPKYAEKAAKIISPKYKPRCIQQPR